MNLAQNTAKIRVVIADDSQLTRDILRELLEADGDIEVVGEAANGKEAIALAQKLKPDVLTMDLLMPVMGGMEAIREIMSTQPLPIMVVSSVADAQNAFESVQRGALEVIRKPDYTSAEAGKMVEKIRILAKVKVLKHWKPRGDGTLPPASLEDAALPRDLAFAPKIQRVFAIASSTGGPQALAQILPCLPANFPFPVLVAQHISEGFAAGMANWLASLSKLRVRLAEDGEEILPGTIYIASSERHLKVNQEKKLVHVSFSTKEIYHPSCDLLLESVAEVFGCRAVGIILSGMGSDGARGMARIRELGGITFAQDEASSVIFGMNKVAIDAGSVQKIFSLPGIADAMLRLADPESYYVLPNKGIKAQ